MDFLPDYNIYKASPSGNGTAAQFKLKVNEKEGDKGRVVFLEMAKQKSKDGNAMDWDSKKSLIIALKIPDLQTIIHTLDLKKSYNRKTKEVDIGCEIFHKSDGKGSTILKLEVNQRQVGFYLTLTYKPANDQAEEKYGPQRNIAIPITPEESTGLKLVLSQAFIKVMCWD